MPLEPHCLQLNGMSSVSISGSWPPTWHMTTLLLAGRRSAWTRGLGGNSADWKGSIRLPPTHWRCANSLRFLHGPYLMPCGAVGKGSLLQVCSDLCHSLRKMSNETHGEIRTPRKTSQQRRDKTDFTSTRLRQVCCRYFTSLTPFLPW